MTVLPVKPHSATCRARTDHIVTAEFRRVLIAAGTEYDDGLDLEITDSRICERRVSCFERYEQRARATTPSDKAAISVQPAATRKRATPGNAATAGIRFWRAKAVQRGRAARPESC